MAVSTAFSSLYSAAETPKSGRPIIRNTSDVPDLVEYTIPTTQIDDATDVTYLIPVASGRRIHWLIFDCPDLDTGGPTLDMDIILRTGTTGSFTDTILYNAGTAFGSAAHAGKWVFCNVQVPDDADRTGHICLYVNTAATTPAAGALKLWVYVGY
jgi:hypothetical protein